MTEQTDIEDIVGGGPGWAPGGGDAAGGAGGMQPATPVQQPQCSGQTTKTENLIRNQILGAYLEIYPGT